MATIKQVEAKIKELWPEWVKELGPPEGVIMYECSDGKKRVAIHNEGGGVCSALFDYYADFHLSSDENFGKLEDALGGGLFEWQNPAVAVFWPN